ENGFACTPLRTDVPEKRSRRDPIDRPARDHTRTPDMTTILSRLRNFISPSRPNSPAPEPRTPPSVRRFRRMDQTSSPEYEPPVHSDDFNSSLPLPSGNMLPMAGLASSPEGGSTFHRIALSSSPRT